MPNTERDSESPLPGLGSDELAACLELARKSAAIGFWRLDPQSGEVRCDPLACHLWGLPEGLASVSLARLRARLAPEDQRPFDAALTGADGPRAALTCTLATADAPPRRVTLRWQPVDHAGARHLLGTIVSAAPAPSAQPSTSPGAPGPGTHTEPLRRADEATSRFELVTRTAGIGYWALEGDAERATWGPALRAMFGLAEGEPVPTWHEWITHDVHPADRDAVRRRFAEWGASRRESIDLVFRILRRDGQVRQVISHTRVEAREPAPLLFGVVIDVSERHSVERALRGARERALLAARGAGIGTWELDLNDGTAYWDEQMWALRGHAPQTGAMTQAQRLACVHPDDRERVVAVLADAMARSAPLDYEFRVIWPDGQVRWLASRSTELVDEVNGARRRIGVNWDITDSRTAEAARREREMALRESQAKSKFLARMSHELRTPLNAVLGFSQLLLVEERDGDPGAVQRRRRVEHIRSAGQHLLSLINDVLDLARVEGGEMRFELEPVALATLVAETLPLVTPQALARQVAIRTGALAGMVRADTMRLRQVLLNLLSNAIKYNREGGWVTIDAETRGTQVCLRVTDTGQGLSDSQRAHLFEPFNRLGADRGPIEGTGIGLAIVKALVEHMEGSVHATSEVGVGSTFEVRLAAAATGARGVPAVAAPTARRPAPAAETPAPVPAAATVYRHRLLYIEDNPVNAQIIRELVARRGDVQLLLAAQGGEGVVQAIALRPHLILLDMQLPDIDGFEVLRRLRADPATAAIPVVALSANAMPEDIRRALDAGMADYWTKPLDFAAFLAQLDRRLGPAPA
jgi:hypothetical protein